MSRTPLTNGSQSSLRWIPNALCIVRILLVPPILMLLYFGHYLSALTLFIFAGFTDGLDGFLAKKMGWQTRLGSLLDPAADKLLMMGVFLMLAYLGVLPIWLAIVVVGRDVVIVLGAIAYQLLIEPVTGQPTLVSKANTACQLLLVLIAMLSQVVSSKVLASVVIWLSGVVLVTSLLSGAGYVSKWSRRAWQSRINA